MTEEQGVSQQFRLSKFFFWCFHDEEGGADGPDLEVLGDTVVGLTSYTRHGRRRGGGWDMTLGRRGDGKGGCRLCERGFNVAVRYGKNNIVYELLGTSTFDKSNFYIPLLL